MLPITDTVTGCEPDGTGKPGWRFDLRQVKPGIMLQKQLFTGEQQHPIFAFRPVRRMTAGGSAEPAAVGADRGDFADGPVCLADMPD